MRFWCIVLFLFISLYASDNQLHLIHADKSLGKLANGERVRILSGNVEAYQDTLFMKCDEAIFYEDRNRVEFHGNVHLDDGHYILRAERIVYNTESRIAICYDNVRISSSKDSLYAEKFIYNFRDRNARGQKNVFVWDKLNNARVWGDAGDYNSLKKHTIIKENARFKHYNKDESDTLNITSRYMEYSGLTDKYALATDSVQIHKGDLYAVCDSALYSIDEEKINLKVNPIAWQADSEMKGQKIDLLLDSLILKEILITGAAQIKSPSDTVNNKFDYLRGKSIEVLLEDRKPVKITARNNASSIYLLKEDDIEQGTNTASSDSIIIYFRAGEIDSIAIMGGSQGIFYPPDYQGDIEGEY
jgi:lipopolysaccharide export system protein LptA